MHSASFIAILSILIVAKNGVGFYSHGHTFESAASLPDPHDYTSVGIIGPIIYRIFNLNNWSWTLFTACILGISFILPIFAAKRAYPKKEVWKVVAIVMACWPALSSTMQLLGHYQAVMLLSVTAALVSRNKIIILFWLVVAGLSLPEQAAFGFIALLIASYSELLRPFRRRAQLGLVIAATWLLISSIWLMVNDVPSRGVVLVEGVLEGVKGFLAGGALGIYSWWGPLWVLVLIMALQAKGKGRWAMLVGAVIIPAGATISTTDGTRVFASVAAPLAVGLVLSYFSIDPSISRKRIPRPSQFEQSALPACQGELTLGMWMVAFLLLPSVVSQFGSEAYRAPWAEFINLLIR